MKFIKTQKAKSLREAIIETIDKTDCQNLGSKIYSDLVGEVKNGRIGKIYKVNEEGDIKEVKRVEDINSIDGFRTRDCEGLTDINDVRTAMTILYRMNRIK